MQRYVTCRMTRLFVRPSQKLPDQQRTGNEQQKNNGNDVERNAVHRVTLVLRLGMREEFDSDDRPFAPNHPASGRLPYVF